MRIFRTPLFALCGMIACMDAPAADQARTGHDTEVSSASRVTAIPLADHHVHVFSPAVRRWLETELNIPHLPASDGDELMAALQKDHVAKAAVLSNAYFFGKDTAKQPKDLKVLVAENDRIADWVARYPDRLAGFFSVNPLADSAFPEIERCATRRIFAGLKLHLANSGVDLRNPQHVRRLAAIFRRANALGLAIVIHMRTLRPDYGGEDARIFIEEVLSAAPDVPVQIAHLAGWGGYDVATDDALSAFVDAATRINGDSDHVYFDVSAVVRGVGRVPDSSATTVEFGAANWWPQKRYLRLAERLRALGLRHIVFGTDWPEWSPRSYLLDLEKNVPLTPRELRILLVNRAPWLRPVRP